MRQMINFSQYPMEVTLNRNYYTTKQIIKLVENDLKKREKLEK